MKKLSITLIQSELHWEDAAKNLALFTAKIEALTESSDIIVLPEMFNTGFSMKSKQLAETMDGISIRWMKAQAKKHEAVLVGSLIVTENKKYYNRLIWAQPDGEVYTYDKRHLFRMANEQDHFCGGTARLIVNYKGWRICPMICYDLRFPVWSRNTTLTIDQVHGDISSANKTAYDVLIYIANWPEVRKEPWSKLLEARAIENQCYVIGVNRVGKDGKEMNYSGNSVAVSPKGELLSNIEEHEDTTDRVMLSLDELTDFRTAFPVGMDGDDVELKS